jgi:hypothetical protein
MVTFSKRDANIYLFGVRFYMEKGRSCSKSSERNMIEYGPLETLARVYLERKGYLVRAMGLLMRKSEICWG